jgi:hypothetical protein
MAVQLNKDLFNSRLSGLLAAWKVFNFFAFCTHFFYQPSTSQDASQNGDYDSIAQCDALFLCAGDPAAEDEPVPKGTAFQVRA